MASKGGAIQSQQEASQDEGYAAPVIKGVKRKRTAATKREQRKKQATEAPSVGSARAAGLPGG